MNEHCALKGLEGRFNLQYNELLTSAQVMLLLPLHLLHEVEEELFLGLI